MRWLARLEVEAEVAYNEEIYDSYAWHKRSWECYPDAPEAKRDFLTRIDLLEGVCRLWILAETKPTRPHWCPADSFALKEIDASYLTRKHYAFDLRANPVRALIQVGPDGGPILLPNGKRKRGKRVPLVKPEELRAWLIRKGEVRCRDRATGADVPGGFKIVETNKVSLEITPMTKHHFRKKEQSAYHGGVQFRGILEVTDQKRFIDSYRSGIGSAKSFGFGLLLLAPIKM